MVGDRRLADKHPMTFSTTSFDLSYLCDTSAKLKFEDDKTSEPISRRPRFNVSEFVAQSLWEPLPFQLKKLLSHVAE